MNDYRDGAGGQFDLPGHIDIGLARGWVARGVVVNQDDRRSVQLQRSLHYFARVAEGAILAMVSFAGRGGTGRRKGLKIPRLRSFGFESRRPDHDVSC